MKFPLPEKTVSTLNLKMYTRSRQSNQNFSNGKHYFAFILLVCISIICVTIDFGIYLKSKGIENCKGGKKSITPAMQDGGELKFISL